MRWVILLLFLVFITRSAKGQSNTITLESSIYGKDAIVISSNGGSTNYGTHPQFLVWWGTTGGTPVYYREYFDYNLSTIPLGSTIQSAILYVYNNGTANDLRNSSQSYIEKVTTAWDEYTITWNNKPASITTNRVTVPSASSSYANIVADITTLIIDRFNNPATTYGFVIRLATEGLYAGYHMASREFSNPALRPKLVVTYTAPFCNLSNIATGKTVTQSSNLNATDLASKVIDSDTLSFNQTAAELKPWWQIDLGNNQNIVKLEIKNRTNCSTCVTEQRLKNFTVFLSPNPFTTSDINILKNDPSIYKYTNNTQVADGGKVIVDNIYFTGRYARIWSEYSTPTVLNIADVKVFTNTNTLPDVTMTTLNEQNKIYPGQSFTINATASDAENSIVRVEFFNGSTKLGEDAIAPYSFTVENAQLGTYSITAKVTDGGGAVSNSSNTLTVLISPLDACISNVSIGKMTKQSSTFAIGNLAEYAIDDNLNTISITNTTASPWLDIDLLDNYNIEYVEILNRTDCCPERLSNFDVFISNKYFVSNVLTELQADTSNFYYYFPGVAGTTVVTPTFNRSGRYLRIRLRGTNYLQIKEVKVYGCGPIFTDQSCYWEKQDSNIYYLKGNVGLGIQNASHTLTVNGTLRAKDYLTTLHSWPDYVFKPEYPRLTMDELTNFISANHHLPHLPDQNQVLANGVDLGHMQSLLLEKIEELTLYLLESREKLYLLSKLK